ncbi:MAG: hypothetical protein LAT50_13095, partial [Ectothiorhodospiraceae bacterium]|nr:hypothetical protein [Ectothiorhodospiraceae bacterium]
MNIQEKVREFCSVISCDVCTRRGLPKVLRDGDFNFPWPGYIGPNYWKNRVLLLGQNPGVSLDRFNSQDRQMADALADLAREENA